MCDFEQRGTKVRETGVSGSIQTVGHRDHHPKSVPGQTPSRSLILCCVGGMKQWVSAIGENGFLTNARQEIWAARHLKFLQSGVLVPPAANWNSKCGVRNRSKIGQMQSKFHRSESPYPSLCMPFGEPVQLGSNP